MKFDTKKQLMDRTRYTAGLINVLQSDVDFLKQDTSECNVTKIMETIREVEKTIQKLHLVVSEMEYILKLEKAEGP